jgi:predicted nucleotidyltransferase
MFGRLFTSRSRSKILELFLSGTFDEMHMREIARKIGGNINSVRRELYHLEDIGILASRKDGNQRYFRVNKDHPIYPELKAIYLKTAGVGNMIRSSIHDVGKVQHCFIFGSFANGTERADSDLDLFIVGDVDENVLIPVINALESKLNRDINYILYTPGEYRDRVERGDRFVLNVLEGKKILLCGEEDDLR